MSGIQQENTPGFLTTLAHIDQPVTWIRAAHKALAIIPDLQPEKTIVQLHLNNHPACLAVFCAIVNRFFTDQQNIFLGFCF